MRNILIRRKSVGKPYVREMSFSSAPSEAFLRLTMHVGSGTPFKTAMQELQVGETVSLFKIKGKMILPDDDTTPVVFVGGGVGMTPFRSMILEARAASRNLQITLLQVQRASPFLFENELRNHVNQYLPTSPEEYLITLKNVITSQSNSMFYICGSQRFIDGAMLVIHELNIIPESRIIVENFNK